MKRDRELDRLTTLLGQCLGRIDEQAYRLQRVDDDAEDCADDGVADVLENEAARLQELVGSLLERADAPAGALPYGAQRRLEIARAMCTGPALLCLDEPAAGLNPRESEELARLLRGIRDGSAVPGAGATSVLLIEHDMGIVMRISDHVVVLDHGKKIAEGPPALVRNDRHVIAAYLGEPEEGEQA